MKDKKIGWIGTGIMGGPMAKHLVNAGYKLNVYNRTKEKANELLSMGCTWYDTPAEIAANSDVIVTIIGFPKDVEECYFGEQGIFKTIKPGTVLIDMTTTKPSLAIKIFEEAGFILRQPGCSACLGMNEDKIPAGKYCISTSNRNFEGRQGPKARTFLASPLTAAAAAITGVVTDVRDLLN